MTFMQKQSTTGPYAEIETKEGTTFLPLNVCGEPPAWDWDPDETSDDEIRNKIFAHFAHYVEGGGEGIQSVERCEGTLYRLSAPGYMDCTEWSPDPDSIED